MGRHVKAELYGCDDSYFCLSGDGAGDQGVYLGTGPQGLYDAPVKVAMKRSAWEIGGKPTAPVRPHRELLIGLGAVGDTPEEWAEADSAIRSAFDYELDPWDPDAKPARLDITTSGRSGTRSLDVLMSESPVMAMDVDPWDYGHSLLPVTLVAPQPMWYECDWLGDDEHPAGWQTSAASDSGSVWIRNPTDRPMKHSIIVTGDGEARIADFSWRGPKGARVPGIDVRTQRDDSGRMLWTPPISATNGHGLRINTDRMLIPLEDFTGTNVSGLWGGNRLLYEVPPYTDWTEIPVEARNVTSATFGILFRQPRLWSRPWGLERI